MATGDKIIQGDKVFIENPLGKQEQFLNPLAEGIGVQEKLVSGSNIKTVNGSSILGEGNIQIIGTPGEQGIQGPIGLQGPAGGVKTSLLWNSGRFYLYADGRWVTDSDDNYGPGYYQFNESGGTGVDPVIEWEHMGIFIPAGRIIKKLHFVCRANSTEITDFEIYGFLRHPNPITRWESGMDTDAEDTVIDLFRELFVDNADPALGGNMVDRRRRTFIIEEGTVNQDSYLSIMLKPVGIHTATRYLTTTYTWEVE